MTYLLLSVMASTAILVTFRLMHRAGAVTRHAIMLNYVAATAVGGVLFTPGLEVFAARWFWAAALEGVFFYLVFTAMARATQVSGVFAASIATRMSVVVPVAVGIVVLGESLTVTKLAGVTAGLVATLLCARKDAVANWQWPLVAFLVTGLLDTSLKLFQAWAVSEGDFAAFMTTIYGFAFVTSLAHHVAARDRQLSWVSIRSGVVLGALNFASLFFLLKALATPGWESSVVFPLNSFGIVTFSTLAALALFRERLTARSWSGIGLATLAIWMLYLSS